MFDLNQLKAKKLADLQQIAESFKIKFKGKSKQDLIFSILDQQAATVSQNGKTSVDELQGENTAATKTRFRRKRASNENNDSASVQFENLSSITDPPEITSEVSENESVKKVLKRKRKRVSANGQVEQQTVVSEQTEQSINEETKITESKSIEQIEHTTAQKQLSELPKVEKKEYDFGGIITAEGVLEIMNEGYGYLRSSDFNYLSSPDDVFVSAQQIKSYGLKQGDTVVGTVRPPKEGEKFFPLVSITEVNGRTPEFLRDRVAFEHLTPLFPSEKFNLAGKRSTLSTRILDLFAPIGKGQRAMIVAQPKTGKTMLLKDIANAIAANHPEVYLMILLVDERPEEVTDMQRSVQGEVIASTFDESADKHVKVANIVLSKAQRMVESGHDVVILLDSITRLARAYNTVAPSSGKVLTGGVDANALHKPKRFFGSARKIENGGSLTIVATALIDTGSKMDEVIFEEFKGTGNMELQLDRKIANKRIYPAIDLVSSSTRRDDLLHDEYTTNKMWILRNYLADMNPLEAMEFVKTRIEATQSNEEFLVSMNG